MQEDSSKTTLFHVANELPGGAIGSGGGLRRRNTSQESSGSNNSVVETAETFKNIQRKMATVHSPVLDDTHTIRSHYSDDYQFNNMRTVNSFRLEEHLSKISAINPPDVNNNQVAQETVRDGNHHHHSTPYGDNKLKYCDGLGKSPAADSGYGYTSDETTTMTVPVAAMTPSPPPTKNLQEYMDNYFKPMSSSKKRLYDLTEEYRLFGKFKLQDAIPILVLAVVAFSSVVAVVTLSKALRGNQDASFKANGKYKSIEFAHIKANNEDIIEIDVVKDIIDDDGVKLGGKRAAIQFAHDLQQQQQLVNLDDEDEEVTGDALDGDIFDALEMVQNLQNQLSDDIQKEEVLSPEAKRERLLNQLGSFGHFSTSKNSYNNNEKLVKSGENKLNVDSKSEVVETEVKSRKKRNLKSKNQDPFRFYKRQPSEGISSRRDQEEGGAKIVKFEDDPFAGFR